MKRNKFRILVLSLTVITGTLILQACKKSFLDAKPYGSYTSELIKNKKGLEGLLIGVYGILDGQGVGGDPWETSAVNWATAGVAADDAYKGTELTDQVDDNPVIGSVFVKDVAEKEPFKSNYLKKK